MLPARVMVSAWNEMGATVPDIRLPPAPTMNARAVGTDANPNERARSPWGSPFRITLSAANKSFT